MPTDQGEHGSTCSRWRAITRLLITKDAELSKGWDRVGIGDIDGHQALMEERDRLFLEVQLLDQVAFAFLDRLEDVGDGEASEALGAEL